MTDVRHYAPKRRETRTPIPGPWQFKAVATRQALLALECRMRDWYTLGMQGDVLDDIVERYKRILADTVEKDAESMRGRVR